MGIARGNAAPKSIAAETTEGKAASPSGISAAGVEDEKIDLGIPGGGDRVADLCAAEIVAEHKIADVDQPHVAKKKLTTRGQKAQTDEIAAWKAKRQKPQRLGLATRGQKKARSKPYIEAVGASVGTMAFRLRWRENGKRQPPIYLSRVSNDVFTMIKQGNYEAFKNQLVASHFAGAVRAGHTA